MAKRTTTAKAKARKGKVRNRAAQEVTLINLRKVKRELAELTDRVARLEGYLDL